MCILVHIRISIFRMHCLKISSISNMDNLHNILDYQAKPASEFVCECGPQSTLTHKSSPKRHVGCPKHSYMERGNEEWRLRFKIVNVRRTSSSNRSMLCTQVPYCPLWHQNALWKFYPLIVTPSPMSFSQLLLASKSEWWAASHLHWLTGAELSWHVIRDRQT